MTCDIHGTSGVRALACDHVIDGAASVDAVVMRDPDGDYPDCLCEACLDKYRGGDVSGVRYGGGGGG